MKRTKIILFTTSLLAILITTKSIANINESVKIADQTITAKEVNKDIALETIDQFIDKKNVDKKKKNWKTTLSMPPKLSFDADKDYIWLLETNKGDIKIKFMPKIAPMHVSSTIYLTRLGFYDDTIFHRVIKGFMAQGGDPLGVGRGGPGYKYHGEYHRYVKHDKAGLLSMANAGPGTDGSQFFITFTPTPHLDGKHTLFGEVIEGMDNVRKLENLGSRSGATMEKLFIEKATIIVQ